MTDQIDPYAYIEQQKEQYKQLQEHDSAVMKAQSPAMFESLTEDNLIQWQLDLKEDLNRIYHLLRGDRVEEGADGGIKYVPVAPEERPFNDHGVQLIMNIMSFYLNRNTLLSNYKEDQIYWKVHDFGKRITRLIWCSYEKMGLDNEDKRKLYPLIVQELVDTVHSAYNRALNGGERQSLREARHVAQVVSPQNAMGQPMQPQSQGKGSIFTRWMR